LSPRPLDPPQKRSDNAIIRPDDGIIRIIRIIRPDNAIIRIIRQDNGIIRPDNADNAIIRPDNGIIRPDYEDNATTGRIMALSGRIMPLSGRIMALMAISGRIMALSGIIHYPAGYWILQKIIWLGSALSGRIMHYPAGSCHYPAGPDNVIIRADSALSVRIIPWRIHYLAG
jgi:hypothetical protein